MSVKAKRRDVQEPKPDADDKGLRTHFLLISIGGYWRVYLDNQGEQLYSLRRAQQLRDHLHNTNPSGYQEIRIVE